MNPVQIVTIKNKVPLFKGEEQANAIEKIELEENGFSLVSQKDLYQIGEKAIYIQPDFSLSDIPLFNSFIRPFGDPKKSKLGSNFRIRAVKFNLHTGDHEPTYSVGILLPYKEVFDVVMPKSVPFGYSKNNNFEELDLAEKLGITKWEEPDKTNGGIKARSGTEFPSGIYKTDETNINNLWSRIEFLGYPIRLIGTEKVDGSSISLIVNDEIKVGSRTYIKSLTRKKVTGRRKPTLKERIKALFGKYTDLNIIEEVENDDDFVQLAKPYIEKIQNFSTIKNVVFRGEACGQNWKGSGNKNNPVNKLSPQILFYGMDNLVDGVAIKAPFDEFRTTIEILGLNRCKEVFDQTFESREQIEQVCKAYFKDNLIEGIVIRTPDCKFSAKFMNDEYDSKK